MLARHYLSYNSVCPSVCLSVRHTRVFYKNQTVHCEHFDTTRKGNYSIVFWQEQWLVDGIGGRRSLPSEICAQSDPPLSKNADFDRFPLITSQPTVTDSEKSSIMTNRKSTTGFPTSYRWSAYFTTKPPTDSSKTIFFRLLWIKFNFSRIQSATMFLCVNFRRQSCSVTISPSIDIGTKRNPST